MPVTVTVCDAGGPVLAVRDHGPGLSETDRERALDRFYRGSASAGVPGSGLGLAIARAVCERHGAELELQAAPGGGTVATVRLPGGSRGRPTSRGRAHDPGSARVPLRAAGLGGAAHGMRAVVVVHLAGAEGDPVEPAVARVRDHDVLVDHDCPGVGDRVVLERRVRPRLTSTSRDGGESTTIVHESSPLKPVKSARTHVVLLPTGWLQSAGSRKSVSSVVELFPSVETSATM